jgi:hypothetical protein
MIPNPSVAVRNFLQVPRGRPVSIARVSERLFLWKDGPVIRYQRALRGAAGIPEKS